MKNYIFKIAFMIMLVAIGINCKHSDEKPEDIRQSKSFSQLPEDFISFYEKFHADTAFQFSHVSFPMEGHRLIRNENGDTIETVMWTRENWETHKKFDSSNKNFKQEFEMIGENVVIETITALEGLFKIERRYAILSSCWNLIYYAQH
jgi:hypothetical protein